MLKKLLLAAWVAMLAPAVQAADLPNYPFIHVNGSGEVRVMPDLGKVDFEIAAVDADAALATQLVNTRIAEIRTLLQGAGIAAEDVEVRDVRKEIKKGELVYEVRCGVKIVVRELAKWQAVVGQLLSMPNLDGFMTGFDITERAKVESALLGDAIKAARRKGDDIAAGFGRKLGAVGGVSVGEVKNLSRSMNLTPSEYFQRGRAPDAPSREELLMIVSVKLAQSVDVLFRIK